MSERWDNHFIDLCIAIAKMSKDSSTRVGAVIVGPDREIRSTGFNGFPRGITDWPSRLQDREQKIALILHAETNALLNAARVGVSVKNCTLYIAAVDLTGAVWGGNPCESCTLQCIQAGIVEFVSRPYKDPPGQWAASIARGAALIREAGLRARVICAEP